jgi:hypothetical protein
MRLGAVELGLEFWGAVGVAFGLIAALELFIDSEVAR